jgi:hypothetical protein
MCRYLFLANILRKDCSSFARNLISKDRNNPISNLMHMPHAAQGPWDEDVVEDSEPEREEQRRRKKTEKKKAMEVVDWQDVEIIEINDTASGASKQSATGTYRN